MKEKKNFVMKFLDIKEIIMIVEKYIFVKKNAQKIVIMIVYYNIIIMEIIMIVEMENIYVKKFVLILINQKIVNKHAIEIMVTKIINVCAF